VVNVSAAAAQIITLGERENDMVWLNACVEL
jgi:hypothetical protein